MNKLIFLLLLILIALAVVVAHCQSLTNPPPSVTLAWGASPGTNVITNYAVWFGPAPATYTNHVNAGTNLTVIVTNLSRGPRYYFSATATDNAGLSSTNSHEVSTNLPVPPGAPFGLTFGP